MSTESRIKTIFDLKSPVDDIVISELTSLCSLFSLTPEQLKNKWHAFALNSNLPLKPSPAYIKHLRSEIQRGFDRSLKTRRTDTGKISTRKGPALDLSEYGMDLTSDPTESFIQSTMKQSKPFGDLSDSINDTQISEISSLFVSRKAAHVLDTQYNGHLPTRGEPVEQSLLFKHLKQPIAPYRYMHEKTNLKADTIDEYITYIGSLIADEHKIETYNDPTQPAQNAIYAYGSISSDSADGTLNDKSVLLQTSKELAMGRRVKLNLNKLESYSLFSGQIVGLRGTNHNGQVFTVEEIFLPPTPKKFEGDMSRGGRPVEVIAASGPFTLSEDLSFKPLEDLLNMCRSQKPDVLLLTGPFISVKHPMIKKGAIQDTPDKIFHFRVIQPLETLLELCPHTRVIMMPHADDILHHYPVFPQPPLNNTSKHARIHMLSNPASFSINEHPISVSNIDILLRLSNSSISKNVTEHNFTRIPRQILQQHSYYPLFPRAFDDAIDAERLIDIQILWKPSILIMPSQLKAFARNIDGTICINPGHLCMDLAAGTYSKITLYPTQNQDEQVRVDLYKL